jgi:hypothetical protein
MDKKKALIGAIIPSIIFSFIISFAIGGFIVPFPQNTIANAVGNGMSGLSAVQYRPLLQRLWCSKRLQAKKDIRVHRILRWAFLY